MGGKKMKYLIETPDRGGYLIPGGFLKSFQLRTLVLTPFYYPNRGGVETFCHELVKELGKTQDVYVASIYWGKQKNWKGLPFEQCFRIIPELFLKGSCYCSKGIYEIYAQGLIAGFVGVLLSRFYHTRLSITTHCLYDFSSQSRLFKALCRWVLNKADVVYTEGKLCKEELIRIGIKKKKIFMYQHWVDIKKFYPNPNRPHNKLRVLFVGRDIPEKGIDIIKEVEKKLTNMRFIYATNIKAQDMPKYYRMADVLVVPSLYSESFARVVLEGCACGLAILASNKGSLPELVDSWFGIVFNPTMDNYIKWISHFDEHRKDLNMMQRNARRYAEEHFTNRNVAVFK